VIAVALTLLLSPALAEDEAQTEPEFDLPRVELHRIPPTASFDVSVTPSFGYYAHNTGRPIPWVGMAIRSAAGIHRGENRWGGAVSVGFEGEVPMHFNVTLEPQITWDRVSGGLLLGASVGPSFLVHGAYGLKDTEYAASLAPAAAVRVGWSQPWTRVGRRMFVYLEPRVRYAQGQLAPTGMLAVGSGWGR
jgi:hypothetical protein